MSEFLLNSELLGAKGKDFMQLVSQQRAYIDEMIMDGKVTSYAISIDRTKLWAVIVAQSESDAVDIIANFPIIDYMQFELHELLFHDSSQDLVSHISLN